MVYRSVEQYLQAMKASSADDDKLHYKIMSSSNPYLIKRLGGKVKAGRNWQTEVKQHIYVAVREKFTQNERLKKALLNTQDLKVAEATRDNFWGIGKNLHEKGSTDQSTWQQEGLMCEIYSRIRSELRV